MKNTGNTCSHCAFKSSAVATLNREELHLLEKGCWQTPFKKGELILKEGAPANYIAYIRDGFVKLVKKGIGGKDFILSISSKGFYLGIQTLNRKSKTYYFSAAAIAPTEICFIDTEKFRELLMLNGTFATEVISTIINDEMNYFDRLVNNVQQQLPGRLANTLLYFKNQVYHDNTFNLNLTKSELAELIGTSRESVSRLLKEFQISNIIATDKNRITILDEEMLELIKQKG